MSPVYYNCFPQIRQCLACSKECTAKNQFITCGGIEIFYIQNYNVLVIFSMTSLGQDRF